jgi:hypothetical protein
MKVQIPFTGYNQQSLLQWIFPTPQDFSNKIVFVRVELDSGFNVNPSAPGGFVLAVKTGNYVYGSIPYMNLPVPAPTTPSFMEFDLDLHAAPANANAGFDATQVVAIELHFDTGGGPQTDGAASTTMLPTPATFHVATIGVQ